MAAMAAAKLRLVPSPLPSIGPGGSPKASWTCGANEGGGSGAALGGGPCKVGGGSFGLRSCTAFFSGSLGHPVDGGEHRRARSTGHLLEVLEVRDLSGDRPLKGDMELPRSPHDALLMRLKSRAARQEAESHRHFLAAYRIAAAGGPGPQQQDCEERLESLIRATERRAEELRQRSEELQREAQEAERQLERMNTMTVARATEAELQAMNPFERSQRRIQEDKREEDLSRQKDESQAQYAKVHRRLQSELIELRDYKVLLQEFRHLRLERLNDTLGRVVDGRKLRACVREMIRHGAVRMLQRLEAAELPLEPWMREVLVNCCHLEIRIEDAEAQLLHLRRQALHPIHADVQAKLNQSKQERFEQLCARTWQLRQQQAQRQPQLPSQQLQLQSQLPPPSQTAQQDAGAAMLEAPSFPEPAASAPGADGMGKNAGSTAGRGDLGSTLGVWSAAPETAVTRMRSLEADVAALRRLLSDMRHNSAAIICNQIRQAEKAGGRDASRQAMEWGRRMLMLLVSEDFAKTTMKELQKSAPTAKLTQ